MLTAQQVWGIDDRPVAERALAADTDAAMVRLVEEFLDTLDPRRDPSADRAGALVRQIGEDASLHRVDDLAARAGMSVRNLQRLFAEYVGISPKWVIRRRRLLDAAERAHSGESVDWAVLAAALGFSDQAHLVRAFTAAVGMPPAGTPGSNSLKI